MANLDEVKRQIERWMRMHAAEFTDRQTGEINCTALVEAWDAACDSGEATLDPDHPAWDIAVKVADNA